MAIVHVFSNTQADFTGTFTGLNSQGSTTTINATDIVRPSDWNSNHKQLYTLIGNTNNSSTVSGTDIVFSGGNNITLIGSGSVIGISGANNQYQLTGNTNNSSTASGNPIVLSGGNNITLIGSGSVIGISAGNGGAQYTALTAQNRQLGASTNSVPGQNSVWLAPFRLVAPLNASTGLHMVSITGTVTSNQTNTVGITWEGALYKVTGTDVSQFDTIFSTTMGFTFWNSGTASVSYSYNVTSSSSAGSNLLTASVFGLRQLTFNIGSTLDTGLYAWGFRQSSSSAGNSSVLRSFNAVMDNPMPVAQGFIGSATNASNGYVDGGTYATTSAAMPASFVFSQIRQTNNAVPYIKLGAV